MSTGAEPVTTRYPALTAWLTGAPETHVWAYLLTESGGATDALLEPLETILSSLDAANPPRLASKRRTFRTDHDKTNQLNLRVELLVAAKLAESGITFEFGGRGEPDIRCVAPRLGRRISLEVTTRSKDDLRALHDEMEITLADLQVQVEIRLLQRPLAISAVDRQVICDRVRQAVIAFGAKQHGTVGLPEVGGQAFCTGMEPIGSRVVLDVGSALADHMKAVEQELFNVLAAKTDQALRNEWDPATLVVVDASRLGLSWLRPEAVWLQILPTLTIDWAEFPYLGLLVVFTSLVSTRFSGACIVRPDATDRDRCAVNELLAAFAMPPLGSAVQ